MQLAKLIARPLYRRQRRRQEAAQQLIEASALFDTKWYLETYPDVVHAGADPLEHYLTRGWREGRDPGPMFTTSAYLKANEDVARSGMNPLLHFVEFGLAEGREGFGDHHVPPSVKPTVDRFGNPNNCVSFTRPSKCRVTWRQAHQLDAKAPLFVAVGELGAGYATDSSSQAAVEAAVQWLRLLSGYPRGDCPRQALPKRSSKQRLLDAWYVNAAQLRTRWDGDELPLVVRAFQCDPISDGELCFVGEGAIASPLDFVDLHLRNPYFPLLIAFTTPDGVIRGIEIFAFPSLCRGGTHYSELLWASTRAKQPSLGVAAVGEDLTKALIGLIRGEVRAAVGQILVDAAHADGNGPLFRSDLRVWLERVLQVDIIAGEITDSTGIDGASTQSSTPPRRISRKSGSSLVVPPDAAPTIASLTRHGSDSGHDGQRRPVPLLVARTDPSHPTVHIDVPADAAVALRGMGDELPWLVPPPGGGAATDFPPAAIRLRSSQALSDAELLIPISGHAFFAKESRPPITWLINAEEWDDQQLCQTVHTAALQRFASGDVVALVGPSSKVQLARVQSLFPGQVAPFSARSEAIRNIGTPLVGCIGHRVLLHDARIADCFSWILSNEEVATASCVVISAERRAGILKTTIVDGGAFMKPRGDAVTPSESADAAAELWRSSYPVLKPSPLLWATRSPLLASWTNGSAGNDGGSEIHLCSSAVTATCLKGGAGPPLPSNIPEPRAITTKVEWLVG